MAAHALDVAYPGGVTPEVVDSLLDFQEGVQRALGVDDEQRTAWQAYGHVRAAATLFGVGGGLFVKVVAVGETCGLQHIAQGLLAPAALHARAAA